MFTLNGFYKKKLSFLNFFRRRKRHLLFSETFTYDINKTKYKGNRREKFFVRSKSSIDRMSESLHITWEIETQDKDGRGMETRVEADEGVSKDKSSASALHTGNLLETNHSGTQV